jgi:hypothetical protein
MLTGIAIGVAATLAVLVVVSILVKNHQDAQVLPFDMNEYAEEQRKHNEYVIEESKVQSDILNRIAKGVESVAAEYARYLELRMKEKK